MVSPDLIRQADDFLGRQSISNSDSINIFFDSSIKRQVAPPYYIKGQGHFKSYVNGFLTLFSYVTLGSYLILLRLSFFVCKMVIAYR